MVSSPSRNCIYFVFTLDAPIDLESAAVPLFEDTFKIVLIPNSCAMEILLSVLLESTKIILFVTFKTDVNVLAR